MEDYWCPCGEHGQAIATFVDVVHVGVFEDFLVGHSLFPAYSEDTFEAPSPKTLLVLHVSQGYSSTELTLDLHNFSLVLVCSLLERCPMINTFKCMLECNIMREGNLRPDTKRDCDSELQG